MTSYMRHRDETWEGTLCAERAQHVVDVGPTVPRTGPHDGVAGRAADPPGGSAVGDNTLEANTIKCSSCREA